MCCWTRIIAPKILDVKGFFIKCGNSLKKTKEALIYAIGKITIFVYLKTKSLKRKLYLGEIKGERLFYKR